MLWALTRVDGPSPRGWGERDADGGDGLNPRTIPTRVGRTELTGVDPVNVADHPHAGGENARDGVALGSIYGPSPRGWGERELVAARWQRVRTIPTRVGRTIRSRCPRPSVADHPHAGGENGCVGVASEPDDGPSPRGWGERGQRAHLVRGVRTIPTRVGRTSFVVMYPSAASDHPHAGGENQHGEAHQEGDAGPSPRGWGEHGARYPFHRVRRTIPTRVGRTSGVTVPSHPAADHPHAGGENPPRPSMVPKTSGPSPRGWGER